MSIAPHPRIHMRIDIGVENLKYELKDYNYVYNFLYHEGCDRLEVEKRDGSEKFTFDIFNHADNGKFLYVAWALPRRIEIMGKVEVSPLDPDIWEFVEQCKQEGPMYSNIYTGAWATLDKESGRVKLLSKGHSPVFNPIETTKQTMKINSTIIGIEKRSSSLNNSKVTAPEKKARMTLRDTISESDWKRYVTNGYVLIKGKSKKVYQVFANHTDKHIRVYENGKNIHDLCIHSKGNVPDSDHIINCMLMVQNDEDDFIKQCNLHKVRPRSTFPDIKKCTRLKNKSLVEILKTNKKIADKLKIPKDWIDVTEDREKKYELMKMEIEQSLGIRGGLRDIAAGRVVTLEEAIEDLGENLDNGSNT